MKPSSASELTAPAPAHTTETTVNRRHRFAAELIALVYITVIAEIAYATGAFYVLFPELAALSHDVFTRPRGTWAEAPVLLVITPVITSAIGIFFTRALPYGYLSVLLTVGGAVAVILALRSPIAPAISAGLLPLVLGVKSWWYPPSVLLGTVLLVALSLSWKRLTSVPLPMAGRTTEDIVEDAVEQVPVPADYYWLVALMLFVVIGLSAVQWTGLRFILFPPLVVIGFEMFGHTAICPWAKRPLLLPLACFMTAAGGLISWRLLGQEPAAAACAMAWGMLVLRIFDLHVPPALAVALLPFVMASPTVAYPLSVGIGTLSMTLWFLLYQSFLGKVRSVA